MAWKMPRRLPRSGNVISFRDFNQAYMHVLEEDGRLNEHNWSDDLATQLDRATELDADVASRFFHTYVEADCSETYDQLGGSGVYAEIEALYPNKGWQVVPGMEFEFVSEGGKMYVLASFQFSVGEIAQEAILHTRFAIRLDGSVLPLSVIGSQDYTAAGPLMESGVSGRSIGVDIDHEFPISAGYHTVALMADVRAPKTTKTSADTILSVADKDLRGVFYNRELFGWEMR